MGGARRLKRSAACAALVLLALVGGALAAPPPLATAAVFDLERYLGEWHQIALLPNRFQAHCAGDTRAAYSRINDGRVRVVNRCRLNDGGEDVAEGVARRNGAHRSPAILEVRFAPAWLAFLPFVWGDYWVIAVEPDYTVALVGAPNREYLWLLARTPSITPEVYQRYVAIAAAQGFDVDRLELDGEHSVRPDE